MVNNFICKHFIFKQQIANWVDSALWPIFEIKFFGYLKHKGSSLSKEES